MPDQDPNPDPNERSILGSDDSADGSVPEEASPEPTDGSPGDEQLSNEQHTASPSTSPDLDELHFDDEDLGEKLRHVNEDRLDDAPFGVIKVDDEGEVLFFNQYESDLSGMDPDDVLGRNFFTQVAPCTNNRLFRGRFKKGVRRGELDETFTYTYTYKMRPTLVDVHLYRDEAGNNWITVQKY